MTKIALCLFGVATATLFAFNDSDLDGVDDSKDLCPNTSMSELVSATGCTIQTLGGEHHFDLIYGLDFNDLNYETLEKTNTLSQTFQADYYHNKFSLQFSTSYYTSESNSFDDSGMNDSFLGAYYTLGTSKDTNIRFGAGVILPTYNAEFNNNKTDYVASANISHMAGDINLFAGYNYTIINDDNIKSGTDSIQYQNTNAITLGAGYYPTQKLYASLAYNTADSIYKHVEDINTASLYMFYTIDTHWFSTFNYAYGLSDSASDNTLSARIGYYF